MKKHICLFLIILLTGLTAIGILSPARAAESDEMKLALSRKWQSEGETLRISLDITQNPGIAGMVLTLSYNSELFTPCREHDQPVSTVNEDYFCEINDTTAGKITYVLTANKNYQTGVNITDTGELFNIDFCVNADASGTAEFTISAVQLSNDDYQDVQLAADSTVTTSISLNHTVKTAPTVSGGEGAAVTVSGSYQIELKTSALGSYARQYPTAKVMALLGCYSGDRLVGGIRLQELTLDGSGKLDVSFNDLDYNAGSGDDDVELRVFILGGESQSGQSGDGQYCQPLCDDIIEVLTAVQ